LKKQQSSGYCIIYNRAFKKKESGSDEQEEQENLKSIKKWKDKDTAGFLSCSPSGFSFSSLLQGYEGQAG
jgi:hypothetical protein